MSMGFRQRNSIKQKMKPYLKIKASAVLSLNEEDFASFVSKIESDPVFAKLSGEYGILSVVKNSRFGLSGRCLSLIEGISADTSSPEVPELIAGNKGAVSLIRRIGREKYEKYFLYRETPANAAEIAGETGLKEREIEDIAKFTDSLAVCSEFFNPSKFPGTQGISYRKIGKIDKTGNALKIDFFAPHYARGRYSIDYPKLKVLRQSWKMDTGEAERLNELIARVEAANARKGTICRALEFALTKQKTFLENENAKCLVPCSQKAAAAEIEADTSVICRAIEGRSIELPSGRELKLKDLFPSRKKVAVEYVREIITAGPGITDEELREILKQRYGMKVSRRSANQYRNEALSAGEE